MDVASTTALIGNLLISIENHPVLVNLFLVTLSFLLGSKATSIYNNKKNKSVIDQDGKGSQALSIQDSPNSSPQTAGENAIKQDGNKGVLATINNSPGASIGFNPDVADPDNALGPPEIQKNTPATGLENDSLFICNEVETLFKANDSIFIFKEDWTRAELYKKSGSHRPSATLYIRVFTSIADLLETKDEKSTVSSLRHEISRLEPWSLDKHSLVSLDEIIENIDRIMFNFFQRKPKV